MFRVGRMIAVIIAVLLLPAAAFAQASIAGVVKDASGAVLPGVTVEASSPALTEKVRTVLTDSNGQYRVVNLPPGSYDVTFTLPGFTSVKRDMVQLTGSFNATVNADLKLGQLAETVTVSAESPVVDVQSARHEQVINGTVLQTVPTSRNYNDLLQMVPGIQAGDGGQAQLKPSVVLFSVHGGSTQDGRLLVDGINTGSSRGGSGVSAYLPDVQNAAEVTFTTSGNLGEAETGGPQMSIVPRSGTNKLSGGVVGSILPQSLQGDNFTPELDAVLNAPAKVLKLYDWQASVGGPIVKDRLWYFFNYRRLASSDAVPGVFANKNAGDPNAWTYDPDFSRQARIDILRKVTELRLNWQATPRNKFSGYYDFQPLCQGASETSATGDSCQKPSSGQWVSGGSQTNPTFGGPNSPETGEFYNNNTTVRQFKWQSPVTNRLLLEANYGDYNAGFGPSERPGNPTRGLIRVRDIGGAYPNLNYRSANFPNGDLGQRNWMAAANYVTGAHNLKVGYLGGFYSDDYEDADTINNDFRTAYQFNNTVPQQVTIQVGPFTRKVRTEFAAFYGQDQWTLGRMTLQGALRFDRAWSYFPEQQIGPDVFVANAIVVPEAKGVLGYNDLSPRAGAAFDVFGNGKTSLKVNFGKYLAPATNGGRYTGTNPTSRMATNTARSWNDRGGLGINNDYIPQCDLTNPAANGECGPWADQNFGKEHPSTAYDPAILQGWSVRPNDWQFGASVQQELLPRVSAEAGYYRRWWHNFADVTDNTLVGAADYDAFSVIAPLDPRLPGGGGYPVTGLLNVTPGLFGRSDNVVRAPDAFGGYTRYWDGVDITVQARLAQGLTLQGGTSTGRLVQDACELRGNLPEASITGFITPTSPYCRTVEPMLTQFKGLVSYTVPKVGVQTSATYSSVPGTSLAANVVVPNAQVVPSLGRSLSGNAQTVTINVLEPNSVYGDRVNRLDLRIGKVLHLNRTRTQLSVDVINALNSSPVLTYNQTFNANWPTPASVLTARALRLTAQLDF